MWILGALLIFPIAMFFPSFIGRIAGKVVRAYNEEKNKNN